MKKHEIIRSLACVLIFIVTAACIRNLVVIDIKVAIHIVALNNNSKDDDRVTTDDDDSGVTTQGRVFSTINVIVMMNHSNNDDNHDVHGAFTKVQKNDLSGDVNDEILHDSDDLNSNSGSPHNDKYNMSLKEYIEKEYPTWSRDSGSIYNEINDIAFAYTDVTEMESRRDRFPSIEQRVKIYMSNWYIPPCPNTQRIQYQYQYNYHHNYPEQPPYVDSSPGNDDSNDTAATYDKSGTSLNTTAGENVVVVQEISLHRPLQTKFEDYVHIPYKPPRRFLFDSEFHVDDTIHFVDRHQFVQCTQRYCIDLIDSFLPFVERHHHYSPSNENTSIPIPILYQFGDARESKPSSIWNVQPQEQVQQQTLQRQQQRQIRHPRIPVIQKARTSLSRSELLYLTDDDDDDAKSKRSTCYKNGERRTPKYNRNSNHDINIVHEYQQFHLEPIIFKLNIQRHYNNVFHLIRNIQHHTPWETKQNRACFRGSLTGRYPSMKLYDFNQLSVYDRCQLLPRCYFTYTHRTSKLIDAKLTKIRSDQNIPISSLDVAHQDYPNSTSSNSTRTVKEGGTILQKIDLMGDPLSMEEMLHYKAIVILQGNDVASGLKWALFSNSIVVMPIPTVTSWAMEEWLIPWVHYVPIEVYPEVRKNDNSTAHSGATTTTTTSTMLMTDAEEKMQWIIDNDSKAKEIAHAGKLWMADLLLHPQASTDEIEIFDEMARRYTSHFSFLTS